MKLEAEAEVHDGIKTIDETRKCCGSRPRRNEAPLPIVESLLVLWIKDR